MNSKTKGSRDHHHHHHQMANNAETEDDECGGDHDQYNSSSAEMKKKKIVRMADHNHNHNHQGQVQGCCQAERCGADLSEAKRYHRRHKVCELHSKSPVVPVAGLNQRFCQQCSRFHELAEFDEAKRSCRRRLAGHNERRRKSSVECHGSGEGSTTAATTTKIITSKETHNHYNNNNINNNNVALNPTATTHYKHYVK